jgi:hypothetical protein
MHFSELCELPIEEKNVIWPQSLDLLKPKMLAYDNIEHMFPGETYMFVDDSEVNLQIPRQRSQWIPIKFD